MSTKGPAGEVDVATASYTSREVVVLLGRGDGSFPQAGAPNSTRPQPDAFAYHYERRGLDTWRAEYDRIKEEPNDR